MSSIVIESAEKGGSLITAELAEGYHRDCFAFPGRLNDEYVAHFPLSPDEQQYPNPLPIQSLLPKEVKKPYYPEGGMYQLLA